jgi:hypothetical protein
MHYTPIHSRFLRSDRLANVHRACCIEHGIPYGCRAIFPPEQFLHHRNESIEILELVAGGERFATVGKARAPPTPSMARR